MTPSLCFTRYIHTSKNESIEVVEMKIMTNLMNHFVMLPTTTTTTLVHLHLHHHLYQHHYHHLHLHLHHPQVGSPTYSELILDGVSHRIKIGSPTRSSLASVLTLQPQPSPLTIHLHPSPLTPTSTQA